MVLAGGAEKLPFRKENPFPSGSTGLLGQAYRYAFVIGPVTGASCLPPGLLRAARCAGKPPEDPIRSNVGGVQSRPP